MGIAAPPQVRRVVDYSVDAGIKRFAAFAPQTSYGEQMVRTLESHVAVRGGSMAGVELKEAVAKALGVPRGMHWHDCRVVSEHSGRPILQVLGTVQAAADRAGVGTWLLSMSHDAGIAAAVVIALG